jgi:hypothetical protein
LNIESCSVWDYDGPVTVLRPLLDSAVYSYPNQKAKPEVAFEIVRLLISRGASTRGIADNWPLSLVVRLKDYGDIWDDVRNNMNGEGKFIEVPSR